MVKKSIKLNSIILLGILTLSLQASQASLADLDYEIVLGTVTTSLNFFSGGISDDSLFNLNGSLGVSSDSQFEPTVGFGVTHCSAKGQTSVTHYGVSPKLA